ncbi:hypothetical protein NP233_g9088 [Leucocoprinus birnbaumii]|uniref:TM7S3/TM198-like domain-containing protein n=1 Tax=Leucocoprinus birnbaumii TaxID=56174 RepID=A0AAD5YMJ6_9AGAR|nr:hypothetical protein NP233_g9088 [Leucocoprinus birnbaumii]
MAKDTPIDDRVSTSQITKAAEALHAYETKKQAQKEETELLPGKEPNIWLNITVKQVAPKNKIKPVKIPIVHPLVDPGFGVLGAILILTGLPSAFWGHKNRWTSFFLTGFYTFALTCCVLIISYGVLPAVNPPSKTLRGMFVLASCIAGFAGGGIAIFFWKGARYCIGAWGGFALGLFIQCFHNGGVIKPIGYRWILYIGKSSRLGVVGFTLSTIPKIHYHVLLISTAFVGSSAFILGVDCYTTAGLKEFYMWNLGYQSLFPKFTQNGIQFPVSQTMQIEMGLIAAVALMGIAVQLRIMKILRRKLREIAEEARRQEEEAELEAATRFADLNSEREAWEKDHPTLGKHGRNPSTFSAERLMKEREGSSSPTTLADESRQRHMSVLSDFKVAPTPEEDLHKSRFMQNPGALPALDLGLGIQDDVPASFIADEKEKKEKVKTKEMTLAELEDLRKKEQLMYEIENIRKNIEILKTEPAAPAASTSQSRRLSLASRRTLSIDATSNLLPAVNPHSRPPRETDPRARVHSMEFGSISGAASPPLGTIGESISRPTSVPLKDPEWDLYLHERKLLQPPSGVTPPIATTPTSRVPMSSAVQEALDTRKRRESMLVTPSGSGTPADGSTGGDDPDDVPLAKLTTGKEKEKEKEKRLSGVPGVTGLGNMGYSTNVKPDKDTGPFVTILPPRRNSVGNILSPDPRQPPAKEPVVKTFEELNERHREKMRNLQDPVTKAEKESADVRDAKERWEKAKRLEKETMMRKQAEKAAALKKQHGRSSGRREAESPAEAERKRQSRSASADRLGGGNSSKKLSVLKVEDWQRYQAAAGSSEDSNGSGRGGGAGAGEFGAKKQDSAVPFPGQSKGQGRSSSRNQLDQSRQKRKSRDLLT